MLPTIALIALTATFVLGLLIVAIMLGSIVLNDFRNRKQI